MIQRIRAYKSNFGSVIIGEIETFAIYRTDYVIWGKDDWALDGLDMHQGLPSDSCLENLNDWIRPYLRRVTISKRNAMINQIDKQLLWIRGWRYDVHAMKRESSSIVEIRSAQAGDLWGGRIICCDIILIRSTGRIQRAYGRNPMGSTISWGTGKVDDTSRLVEYNLYKTKSNLVKRGAEIEIYPDFHKLLTLVWFYSPHFHVAQLYGLDCIQMWTIEVLRRFDRTPLR